MKSLRPVPKGEKLGAEKGINLPETRIDIPALTPDDLEALKFILQHADLVGYSFVRTESDVCELLKRLEEMGGQHLGLILKIETRKGFDNLPKLILAAMRMRSFGVMIARGDLAVECGYQRLAEVQEEILWICEAAHVPVIWATQVLETLAKKGMPSRSESRPPQTRADHGNPGFSRFTLWRGIYNDAWWPMVVGWRSFVCGEYIRIVSDAAASTHGPQLLISRTR